VSEILSGIVRPSWPRTSLMPTNFLKAKAFDLLKAISSVLSIVIPPPSHQRRRPILRAIMDVFAKRKPHSSEEDKKVD